MRSQKQAWQDWEQRHKFTLCASAVNRGNADVTLIEAIDLHGIT